MHKQTLPFSCLSLGLERSDVATIHSPLTHDDMLILQDAVLQPGVHRLHFHDLARSRTVLNTCLQYCNKTVGHLSMPSDSAEKNNINLYDLLSNCYTINNLDDFFLDHSDIDLLWIEFTPTLSSCPWISTFEKRILDFNLQNTIPIIIVSCTR